MFWIATCAVIAAVVLLREILLPFVAGMVLAYLFNPLANRLERFGLSRLLAALAIIGAFIVGWVALLLLTPDYRAGTCPLSRQFAPLLRATVGYLFGIVGLLLAVPLVAACRVLLRFAMKQYYASPLYATPPDEGPPMGKAG
jgi:predicted PurR-regulated permease PerM